MSPPLDASGELLALVAELREEVRGLAARVAQLEQQRAAPAAAAPPGAEPPPRQEVSEEDLLAIAAAVAAFLGVRAHIRQVRLIHSAAWGQVGRVTVQASHRLH